MTSSRDREKRQIDSLEKEERASLLSDSILLRSGSTDVYKLERIRTRAELGRK